MSYFTLGHRLPHFLTAPLFGDRKRFGLIVQPDDPCWLEYSSVIMDMYEQTQKRSVGAIVNNAGYRVMEDIDMAGKRVLEIGPGNLEHIKYWQGKPDSYVVADIRQPLLDKAIERLEENDVRYSTALLERSDMGALPFENGEFDIVVSFYSLEHLYPINPYIQGMLRVVKSGGLLVGAIPCEGGIAWGLGRYFTSRRWFLNNTKANPDKIICWEHPNFADQILLTLDSMLKKQSLVFWPLRLPSIDINLVAKFIYEKR